MLIQFSVENYLSFKERAVFSMLAGKDPEHPEALVPLRKNEQCLKVSVIYGANASGKSNLLNAFWFMVNYVLTSHEKQLNLPTGRIPFQFDSDTPQRPSVFEVIFSAEGVQYAYGFSLTEDAVEEEYLYHYPRGRKALIFERTHSEEYRFTTDSELQNNLKERNSKNKLYLSTAANWNYKKVIPAFNWFSSCLVLNQNTYGKAYGPHAEELKNDALRGKIAGMLRVADFGIQNIRLKEESSGFSGAAAGIYDNIEAIHKTVDAAGSAHTYALNMREESMGTNTYFNLIGLVCKALDSGSVFVADEMDAYLHPLLTEYLVSLFQDEEQNPKNAQLVFVTHNTNLLNLELLRRDQIWFTEKDRDTSASALFSLDEFSVRKDAKVEKNYLVGRYGAIPVICGGLL